MAFRLPCRIDSIYKIIVREQRLPVRLRNREQAARVGWRVVKDWLAAQLALIAAGMADLEEVFLPYVQCGRGETLYESLRAKGFQGLALPMEASV